MADQSGDLGSDSDFRHSPGQIAGQVLTFV